MENHQPSQGNKEQATSWHAIPVLQVVERLGTDADQGLSDAAAAERLKRYGVNSLQQEQREVWWAEALESLTEPLQLLLLAVAAAYFWLGETGDAVTILGVILVVAGIEVSTEVRAKRAVDALSSLAAPNAAAIRAGNPRQVPARDLVPGDLVLLSAGARVPADMRLVESAALRIDESSLTGESLPVSKDPDDALSADAELGDRTTMAYAGTIVTAGKGRGLVSATGMQTEIGRIAGMVKRGREPRTPLQKALSQLAAWLVWVAVGFSLLVPILGVLVAGQSFKQAVLVGLTLAFATIPEELPILITIVLGLGAFRLAKKQAIVKQLRAAETLGSVSVVATDKTGTLTESRMRLVTVLIGNKELSLSQAAGIPGGRRVLMIGAVANDAQIAQAGDQTRFSGDPTETALLQGAADVGIDVQELRRRFKVIDEYPFSDDRKRMSLVVEEAGQRMLAAKGSPESILSVCTNVRHDGHNIKLSDAERGRIRGFAEAMAASGLRVLAIAEGPITSAIARAPSSEAVEQNLTLLGLVGLQDPPRPEAANAVKALQRAGVRILMVTGDHPATARAIAAAVGIDTSQAPVRGASLEVLDDHKWSEVARRNSVFARSTPEHKLKIVRALQADGEVVAVTGDGVNDAPALKEAAIGVAMGRIGTDVARESADLILADDNFATITEAVRTGRVLFANLRKAVRYYLAAKVALVSSSLAAVLLKLPVPFDPVQIILMELFMDLGASVTFVSEPAEEDVMKMPPQDRRRPFMDRTMQLGILFGGLSLGAAVLISYLGAMRLGDGSIRQAHTAAFAAWMIGHVALAAHMRAERQPLMHGHALANRAFLVWAGLAVGLIVVAAMLPPLQRRLHLADVDSHVWGLVILASVLLPSWWEPWKWVQARRQKPMVVSNQRPGRE